MPPDPIPLWLGMRRICGWLVIPNVANVAVVAASSSRAIKSKQNFFDISSIFRLKFQSRTRQQKADGYALRPLS